MIPLLLLLTQAGATREERVLDLLRELQREGSWHYARALYRLEPAPLGEGTAVVAEPSDVTCGNSDYGTIDDASARRAALELGSIFGLTMAADRMQVEGRYSVRLDGVDAGAGIGFELRGLRSDWPDDLVEPDALALDGDELAWLRAQGLRLHVADLQRYRNLDQDDFTGTLAYLAGWVGFLDKLTEGEDVQLGGLLFEREATWDWPPDSQLDLPEGMRLIRPGFRNDLYVERAGKLVVPCRGRPDFGEPIAGWIFEPAEEMEASHRRRALPASTCGAPSAFVFRAGVHCKDPARRPELRMRLRQTADGIELVHETSVLTAFLPSVFDLARPFVVELELPPGRYTFYGRARIGAAAPR